MAAISVVSLNCHGFNMGIAQYLHRVASNADLILLQETWLSDTTCQKLTSAFTDFTVYHSSAMEDKLTTGCNSGRPYGGTAVLIHKRLSNCACRLVADNPRLTAIRCHMKNSCDVVICSVYMPFNDNSLQYYIEFESVIGEMQGFLDKFYGCKFIFGGDFNISKSSSVGTYDILNNFCTVNNFMWLDPASDAVNYTYHNDSLGTYTLIDHFLCSPQLNGSCSLACTQILTDGDNTSDHLAIKCEFRSAEMPADVNSSKCTMSKLIWEKADLEMYQSVLRDALSHIALPYDALLCSEPSCKIHGEELECYYNALVYCLNVSGQQCVPSVKVGLQKHWWSPDLDQLKQKCIDMCTLWESVGRPRSGNINAERLRCKYRYKQAIKVAMQESDRQFNDELYDHLCKKDETSFWKAWRKRFCSNSVKPTNVLNGKVGVKNVLSEFTAHFASIVQPHTTRLDDTYAVDVQQLLAKNDQQDNAVTRVSVCDVDQCIGNLKRHKAAYLDGVSGEHLTFGGPQLVVHLTLLFNSMLHHCLVPNDFCQGITLPLLKHKHGDSTNVNMYRGITISPVISKVFESVLLQLHESYLISHSLQYGFKKNNSCCHALFTVTESVNYFTKRGSKVYCAFLDASKAFDKVLHNGIYKKLLERGAPVNFIRLLQNWYGRLKCRVRWNDAIGESFPVTCGVRQGGILSPYLFALYVDDVIIQLKNSDYGICIGQVFVGCVLYADDIALLSASCYGLQKLVTMCKLYGEAWDIMFNSLKSQLIAFGG